MVNHPIQTNEFAYICDRRNHMILTYDVLWLKFFVIFSLIFIHFKQSRDYNNHLNISHMNRDICTLCTQLKNFVWWLAKSPNSKNILKFITIRITSTNDILLFYTYRGLPNDQFQQITAFRTCYSSETSEQKLKHSIRIFMICSSSILVNKHYIIYIFMNAVLNSR